MLVGRISHHPSHPRSLCTLPYLVLSDTRQKSGSSSWSRPFSSAKWQSGAVCRRPKTSHWFLPLARRLSIERESSNVQSGHPSLPLYWEVLSYPESPLNTASNWGAGGEASPLSLYLVSQNSPEMVNTCEVTMWDATFRSSLPCLFSAISRRHL